MKSVFTVGFSRFPDGRPAEIFLNVAPSGGELEKLPVLEREAFLRTFRGDA